MKQERIAQELASHWHRLGMEFGTDKATHLYMSVYERLLGPGSPNILRLLEIGVQNGNSIRMWLKLLPNAHVYAIDYDPAAQWLFKNDPRVTVFTAFQQDPAIANLFGPCSLDVIVDDGGHFLELQRDSLQILWPCLKVGGLYFVEDILTDEYPNEVARYRADPDCIHAEANKHDIYGNYERADAIAIMRKSGERNWGPLMSYIHDSNRGVKV